MHQPVARKTTTWKLYMKIRNTWKISFFRIHICFYALYMQWEIVCVSRIGHGSGHLRFVYFCVLYPHQHHQDKLIIMCMYSCMARCLVDHPLVLVHSAYFSQTTILWIVRQNMNWRYVNTIWITHCSCTNDLPLFKQGNLMNYDLFSWIKIFKVKIFTMRTLKLKQ